MGKRRSQNSTCSWGMIWEGKWKLHTCLSTEMREGSQKEILVSAYTVDRMVTSCWGRDTLGERSLQTSVREIVGSIRRRVNFHVCMELSNGHLNILSEAKICLNWGERPLTHWSKTCLGNAYPGPWGGFQSLGYSSCQTASLGWMEPTQGWRRQSINY